jgi:hypothetical protein
MGVNPYHILICIHVKHPSTYSLAIVDLLASPFSLQDVGFIECTKIWPVGIIHAAAFCTGSLRTMTGPARRPPFSSFDSNERASNSLRLILISTTDRQVLQRILTGLWTLDSQPGWPSNNRHPPSPPNHHHHCGKPRCATVTARARQVICRR